MKKIISAAMAVMLTLAFAFALTGCGSSGGSGGSGESGGAATDENAVLAGTVYSRETVYFDGEEYSKADFGEMYVAFLDDGTFQVTEELDGEVISTGTYQVTGDSVLLVFDDPSNEDTECSIEGDQLTARGSTEVEDDENGEMTYIEWAYILVKIQ